MSKNLPRFLEPKIRFMIVVHLQRCFKKTKWFGKNARAKAKGDRRERGEEEDVKKARHTILDAEDRTRGGNAPVDWILISFG